jgi:hypothetical protein
MMREGAGLLTEEVGGHVGVATCEKPLTEAAVAMAAAKCQHSFSCRRICLGAPKSLVF